MNNKTSSVAKHLVLTDSFGDGFYAFGGDGHLTVPNDWTPLWHGHRPEWKPKHSPEPEVYDGDWASGVHVRYNIHDGFLVRKLDVQPGLVKASMMAMLKSHLHSGHGVQIGIDPHGGDTPYNPRVVWSDWYATHNKEAPLYEYGKWVELSVEAITNGHVTIFLRSKNDHAHDLSAAHFDFVQVFDSGSDTGIAQELLSIRTDLSNFTTSILSRMDDLVARIG